MIIAKQPLPGDEVDFQDAPPSYDALDNVPPPLPRDEKAGPSTTYPPAAPHLPSSTALKSPITPPSKSAGKRPSSSWFNFGPAARASKEVRTTIQGLIRDLVKQNDPHGALGVLESCADACRSFDLAISSLLQERTIEGHTPLYWAIINRPAESAPSDEPDLVTALLSHAAPLSDATVDELRLACLHTSDHGLFQRLRRTPAFSPLSGSDELILGGNVPVDDVDVEDVPGDESGFVARFRMPMFQKRMRISEEISLEFIAKGRLWALKFIVAKDHETRAGYQFMRPGSWVAVLSLLPHSPPTWIDSRLVIEDPRARTHPPPPPDPTGPPTSLREAVEGMMQFDAQPGSAKPKPKIELRMKRSEQLTAPPNMRYPNHSVIPAPFEENTLAHSLQFKGCPYIESDGSLVARLEARLVQPSGQDCIIC
ncbi:uncharacterized protein TRAVEDRAFT_60610 [Trametes versicolor FP-101664 SS1]|uniref:uncharacterized protein n=1 Tax=Trametes versicolor (strain FP-101664) TaxID=717944 RepID=UPI0004623573|nr:uncharacterized protein TRAVEDRAFT_60610 [Trametes versicolor FP-101664 SS1]EIW54156.1 hypothetical protein TRAVEDRAFT_60610 [Trametes versicolor FP-101664 SS1]